MANILDNSADMVIATDTEKRIVAFNEGAPRILGYAREEKVGTQAESLWISPEVRNEILELMDKYGYVSNSLKP